MVNPFGKENIIDFEKSFEGTGKGRLNIYDVSNNIGEKFQEIDCPNLIPEVPIDEENMLDQEFEDEIMREILEEEKRKREELNLDDNEDEEPKKKKKKKKSKGKKKKSKKQK